MKLKESLKKFFEGYQREFWFVQLAHGELQKPLVLTGITLSLMTFLAVYGIKTKFWLIGIIYVVAVIVLDIIGRLYVATGAPKYLARLNNDQNNEIQKILADLEEIKSKLDKK